MTDYKRKLRIYLANAYTAKSMRNPDEGRLIEHKRRLLESYVGGRLKKMYDVTLVLPIAISAAMADLCQFDTGFDQWADDDYNFIDMCDQVWVLTSEGWKESYGVQAEIKFAKDNDKSVLYVHPITLNLTDEPVEE